MFLLKNVASYLTFQRVLHKYGEDVEPHMHDSSIGGYDYELVYVLGGDAIHNIEGESYRITKGTYFFVDYGLNHSYEVLSEDGLELYNIIFDYRALDLLHKRIISLSELAAFHGVNPDPDDNEARIDFIFEDESGEILGLFQGIGKELSERLPGYHESARCILMELLIKGLRQYYCKGTSIKCSPPVRALMDYISTFYMENPSLSALAEQLHISLPYLSKKFKDEVGETFTVHLNKRRITESCRMLSTSDECIENIAEYIGYSDSKKYREKFKEYMGITPREYRKKMRSDI